MSLCQTTISEDETTSLSTGDHQVSSCEPSRMTSPSEKGKHPASDRGREAARKGGSTRLAVQFSDETPSSSPRPSPRDVGDVMQFFAEQEKSLQDSFLSLPKRSAKKQRSPSPKVIEDMNFFLFMHLVVLVSNLSLRVLRLKICCL